MNINFGNKPLVLAIKYKGFLIALIGMVFGINLIILGINVAQARVYYEVTDTEEVPGTKATHAAVGAAVGGGLGAAATTAIGGGIGIVLMGTGIGIPFGLLVLLGVGLGAGTGALVGAASGTSPTTTVTITQVEHRLYEPFVWIFLIAAGITLIAISVMYIRKNYRFQNKGVIIS